MMISGLYEPVPTRYDYGFGFGFGFGTVTKIKVIITRRRSFDEIAIAEHGNDIVDFIPGIPSIRVADLPRVFLKDDTPLTLRRWPYKFSTSKVKCLLLGTAYELEPQVCDVFKEKLEYPVYFVGPLIPYYELYDSKTSTNDNLSLVYRWF
ncbi:hypothetical protein QYF36_015672 [Acer negundo]|nr:hypothetical protein QYF36_015672 [Acer negundo]